MPFSGTTFSLLFDWIKDAVRNNKINDARLEAEFAGIATGLSTVAAGGAGISGAALTKTDDTNITLTLGGTPATALLFPTSITVNWAGQLSATRGGTGVNNGSNTLTLNSGTLAFTMSQGNSAVAVPASGTLTTIENTWPSFNYYGGVSGGSTATNDTAIGVVEGLTPQEIHVPYGTYATGKARHLTTDLRKQYTGPGTLKSNRDQDGNVLAASASHQLGRNFVNSYTNVDATTLAVDAGSELTWFDGDWSRCILPIEYVLSGALISSPASGGYYQPFHASPIAIQMFAKNGSLHRDTNDGTANVAPITLNVKNDTNGGGTGGLWVNVNVARTFSSFNTSAPTQTTVGGGVGGNIHANAHDVFLSWEEAQLSDGGTTIGTGYRTVGIHTSADLHRTKAADASNPNAYWTAYKAAAGSSLVDIDGAFVAQGPFKAVFDTTCATISGAALAVKAAQGIYLNATAKSDGTGVDSVGTTRIVYDSGVPGISIISGGQETLSVRAAGLVIDGTSGINLFGKGGTGTTPQVVLVNGGSGSGGGGHFSFQANSVAAGSFGIKSGIFGGTSRNIVLYMDTPAIAAMDVNGTTGNITFGGGTTTFGLGGTGGSVVSLALDGGSASGGGGYASFQANSVEYGRFGLKSAVTGGTSRNIALYMPTPAINAIDVDATTGGVTLNAALTATSGTFSGTLAVTGVTTFKASSGFGGRVFDAADNSSSGSGASYNMWNTNGAAGATLVQMGMGPNASDTTSIFFAFYDAGANAAKGSIKSNGSATLAFNTTSDERGKPNRELLSLNYARSIIDALEIYDFDKDGNAIRGIGVIAQQAHAVHKSLASPGRTSDEWWQAEKAAPMPFVVANLQLANREIDRLSRELSDLKQRFAAIA